RAIITSADGLTWTTRYSGGGLYAIRFLHDRWLAVGSEISGQTERSLVVSSLDAVTWTKQYLPTGTAWTDLAYGGGYFVLVGRDQPGSLIGRIASSPDGTNWTF